MMAEELRDFILQKREEGQSYEAITQGVFHKFRVNISRGSVSGVIFRARNGQMKRKVSLKNAQGSPQTALETASTRSTLVTPRAKQPRPPATSSERFRVFVSDCQWENCSEKAARGSYCAKHGEIIYRKPERNEKLRSFRWDR